MHAPLHIVLANSTRVLAGAERFVLDAAVGLAGRGHRITVQCYPGAPLSRAARAEGLDTWEVTTRADAAPWTVLPLARRYGREAVDVVLTNYEKDLRTAGTAARLSRRAIAVVHSRECDVPLKSRPHYWFYYRRVAHRVLTNSEATRQTALNSVGWLDPSRIVVLPKGVPTVARRAPARRDRVVLGFAGQLVPRKRGEVLLDILARPELRERAWELRIAGAGPQRDRWQRRATELFGPDRVRFLGHVQDMNAWFDDIDALVLPSLVEGFGYVLAEAAAAGRPVIAMRSSSAPEVVVEGQTGLLAEPDDPGSLAQALATLIDDQPLRLRLGERAAQLAAERFSLPTMLDRLEDELRTTYHLIAGPPSREAHA